MSSRLAPDATTLRPVDDDDAELLLAVYASTREQELARVPWSDGERDAFLRQQFTAQAAYWRRQRPDAQWSVIEVGGRPAGRLYIDRGPRELRIVDIALLPEFRGQGIGGALLGDVLAEAAARNAAVTIHVERDNRARTLYARLGFRRIDGGSDVYDLFEWTPEAPS